MPQGWVHATVDLVAYGRPYFKQHQKKDAPWKQLGWKHRQLNHEYYNFFGKLWDFQNPFPSVIKNITADIKNPDEAERLQSWISHDYLDRLWNSWTGKQRKWFEGFCMYLIRRPKTLREWAGVDVKKGMIKRMINGKEVWEDCPEITAEWKGLKYYIKVVKIKRGRQ